MHRRKSPPNKRVEVIDLTQQRRPSTKVQWDMPAELVLMILDILIAKYHAFSSLDKSRPYGPCYQALRDVVSFVHTCRKWNHMIPDRIMDEVKELMQTAVSVRKWYPVASLLRRATELAIADGMPAFNEGMPNNLRYMLRNDMMELGDRLEMDVSYTV
jgi:hypothetical protein